MGRSLPCSLVPSVPRSLPSQVFLNHALPRGPVVRIPRVPYIQLVRDPLVIHETVHVLVLAEALVVPARREYPRIAAVVIEEPAIAQMRQEVGGLVEIDILVVVAVEKVGGIECAGH